MESLPHHVQHELCTSRPQYRQGRKLTAVKVYTIASESRHLLFHGVPDLNLRNELKMNISKYGKLEKLVELPDYKDAEQFTKVYHAVFCDIKCARFTKRKLDANSFYGGILHVCYAPEMESVADVKAKMHLRRADVLKRLNINSRAAVSHVNNTFGESSNSLQGNETFNSYEPLIPEDKKVFYGPQLPERQTYQQPNRSLLETNLLVPRQIRLIQKRSAVSTSLHVEGPQEKDKRFKANKY